MRPRHPHAAESGVGKHTARESEAYGKYHQLLWPESCPAQFHEARS
jgi:hypothetical protein